MASWHFFSLAGVKLPERQVCYCPQRQEKIHAGKNQQINRMKKIKITY